MAQVVEHLATNQGAEGSSPFTDVSFLFHHFVCLLQINVGGSPGAVVVQSNMSTSLHSSDVIFGRISIVETFVGAGGIIFNSVLRNETIAWPHASW